MKKENIKTHLFHGTMMVLIILLALGNYHREKDVALLKQLPLTYYHQGYIEEAINVLNNKLNKGVIDFDTLQWKQDSTREHSKYINKIYK